ncbi:hypothetical protein BCM40_08200 [Planococcus donghaensis]|uniref:Uncharacterized protein n=1 Tax=Planococcus donghaensis TaxID=414778 RepID=A0A1C7EH11_9BACL|nr:hypothetical protein BCM40_08200 [Planococcus donghaensis]
MSIVKIRKNVRECEWAFELRKAQLTFRYKHFKQSQENVKLRMILTFVFRNNILVCRESRQRNSRDREHNQFVTLGRNVE